MSSQELTNLILLLLPIIIIQLGLVVYSLFDLAKRKQVKGQRWMWALALILTCLALPTGMLVVAIYLFWGRNAT
jgi:hypothetical protein